MLISYKIITPGFDQNFPLIDPEFDRFELNAELEETLREAETANFYHDLLNSEE